MTVATTTCGTGGGTEEAAFLQPIAPITNPAASARAAAFRTDRGIWYRFIERIGIQKDAPRRKTRQMDQNSDTDSTCRRHYCDRVHDRHSLTGVDRSGI